MTDIYPVDCFYIGTMRSGSTWLYYKLSSVRSIAVHKAKETYFFDRYYSIDSLDDYEYGFIGADSNAKVKVDISPTYTENIKSLYRIKKYNPNAKFIFVYREHYELVISQYRYLISNGFDVGNFNEYWLSLKKDKFLFSGYLKELVLLFGLESICFFRFEDVMKDKNRYLDDILKFLNVENDSLVIEGIEKSINSSTYSPFAPSLYRYFRRIGSILVPFIGLSRVRYARNKIDFFFRKKQLKIVIPDHVRADILEYYNVDRRKIITLFSGCTWEGYNIRQ